MIQKLYLIMVKLGDKQANIENRNPFRVKEMPREDKLKIIVSLKAPKKQTKLKVKRNKVGTSQIKKSNSWNIEIVM